MQSHRCIRFDSGCSNRVRLGDGLVSSCPSDDKCGALAAARVEHVATLSCLLAAGCWQILLQEGSASIRLGTVWILAPQIPTATTVLYSLSGSPCHWSPRQLIGWVSDSDRVALVVVWCGLPAGGCAQHILHSMWPCGGCDGGESLHMIHLRLNTQPLAVTVCRRRFCRLQTWTITLQLLCLAGSVFSRKAAVVVRLGHTGWQPGRHDRR